MAETLSNSGFRGSDRAFGSLKIHRLTLMFDVPKILSDDEKSLQFYKLLNNNLFDAQEMKGSELFEYSVKWHDVHISWGRGTASDVGALVRMELEPSTFDWSKISKLLKILSACGSILYSRVSRVDVAVDYPYDLNPHMFYDKFKRKSGLIFGSKGLETQYLGMRSSDVQIRIYDKATEQREKFDIKVGESWWRIEAEVKKTFNVLEIIDNPFKNLFYAEDGGKTIYPTSDYIAVLFWSHAEKVGINQALKVFPQSTRKKFKKKYICDVSDIDLPSEVFNREYEVKWFDIISNLQVYSSC